MAQALLEQRLTPETRGIGLDRRSFLRGAAGVMCAGTLLGAGASARAQAEPEILSAGGIILPNSFTCWGYPWNLRQGQLGANFWNGAGVTKDPRMDRLRLSLADAGNGPGAGVNLAQDLGYGVYETIMLGRFDSTNANTNIGCWMYNDDPDRSEQFELDYEHCQWGDQNRPDRIQLSVFAPNMVTPYIEDQTTFPSRSFEKHRITLTYLPNLVRVRADGWWTISNTWQNYGYFEKQRNNPPGATFRAGMYLHTDRFLKKAGHSIANGVSIVYIDKFKFTPM